MGLTLHVYPDSLRAERALVALSREQPIVDASLVLTLNELLELCAPAAALGRELATPALTEAVLWALAPRLAVDGFGAQANHHGFARAVARVLGELEQQDVEQWTLRRACGELSPGLGRRVSALADLWQAALGRLHELGAVLPAARWRIAARRLEDGLPAELQRVDEVVVHHLHDTPPARLRFLEALALALARQGKGFTWWYPAAGAPEVDLFVNHALKHVERRWAAQSAQVLADVPLTPRGRLAAAVFGGAPWKGEVAGQLRCVSAASPRDEAAWIAQAVRRQLDEGTPPERILVATPDLEQDGPLLREALGAVGVPARVRASVRLSNSPLGRRAASLPTLADDGFPRADVLALLEAGVGATATAPLDDPARWLAEAGAADELRGGKGTSGAYAARFRQLDERLAERGTERERRAAQATAAAVAHLVARVGALPSRGTWGGLLDRWWQLVGELGLLTPRPRPPTLDRALLEAHAVDDKARGALRGLAQQLGLVLQRTELHGRACSRREFADWLRASADEVRLSLPAPRIAAVPIVRLSDLPGLGGDVLFLCGARDGRLPRRERADLLLSDDERAQVNRAAGQAVFRLAASDGALVLDTAQAEDRLLFHVALTAAPAVTLTWPRADATGKPLLPSPLIEALRRACPGVALHEAPRRVAPPLDEALTPQALGLRAALEALSPSVTRLSAPDARGPALTRALAAAPWFSRAKHVSLAERERARFFGDPTAAAGPFSGLLDAAQHPLLRAAVPMDRTRPVSSKELEEWGTCLFQGFGLRLLHLRPLEAQGDDVDARARGVLLHHALRSLVPELVARGLWAAVAPSRAELAPLVEAAVRRAAEELGPTLATGHPALWAQAQVQAVQSLLRALVEHGVVVDGCHPAEFEASFGRDPARPVEVPAAFPGEAPIALAGRFDRVDRSDERAVAIDYKRSRVDVTEARLLRTSFQLPLYVFALTQLYPGAQVDGVWVPLRRGKPATLSTKWKTELGAALATDAATRARLREEGAGKNLANALHALRDEIYGGAFGARPVDCGRCELGPVCRIRVRAALPEGPGGGADE